MEGGTPLDNVSPNLTGGKTSPAAEQNNDDDEEEPESPPADTMAQVDILAAIKEDSGKNKVGASLISVDPVASRDNEEEKQIEEKDDES